MSAAAGPFVLLLIKKRTTAATAAAVRHALLDVASQREKFGFLCMIGADADLVASIDAGGAVQTAVRPFVARFTGSAVVLQKTGFQAATVRSIIRTSYLASRTSHPNRVFSEVREGVAWLAELTPGTWTVARLVDLIETL